MTTPIATTEPVLHECSYCHEQKPCTFERDPYLMEIHPEDENPSAWWCEKCLDIRRWDV